MGILIGITMFTASFAAMTLLPALLRGDQTQIHEKNLCSSRGKAKAEAKSNALGQCPWNMQSWAFDTREN
jgi:uncharacterized membrane protein YdfJ with MMPL/SSD domain